MVSNLEEVDQIFGPDGAMETFLRAKKEGKIRYIGFSAHDEQAALRMMELFEFETILYPINCACLKNANFGPMVYETAKKQDMGVLAKMVEGVIPVFPKLTVWLIQDRTEYPDILSFSAISQYHLYFNWCQGSRCLTNNNEYRMFDQVTE
jgi:hypothetical protein